MTVCSVSMKVDRSCGFRDDDDRSVHTTKAKNDRLYTDTMPHKYVQYLVERMERKEQETRANQNR